MNNKGFAASVIVYSVFIFLITLIVFFLNIHTKNVSSSVYGDESLKGYVNRIVPYDICLNNTCTNTACVGVDCLTGNNGGGNTDTNPLYTKGTLAHAIVGGKSFKNVIGRLEESRCYGDPSDKINFYCDPDGPTTEVGLYKEVNNDAIEYYYTGNVGNNYVIFGDSSGGYGGAYLYNGKYKYLWRIVRINGDGTIKVALAGLLDNHLYESAITSWDKIISEDQQNEELLNWHDLRMAGVRTLGVNTDNAYDVGVSNYSYLGVSDIYLQYYPKTTDSYLNFSINSPGWEESSGIGVSYKINSGYHSTFEYCYDKKEWGSVSSGTAPTDAHDGGYCKWFYDCWKQNKNCDHFGSNEKENYSTYITDVYISAIHSDATLNTSGGYGSSNGTVNIVGILRVRPVLNLKADVKITGGNGTYASPYIIDES